MAEKTNQRFSPTCNSISLELATKILAFVDMFFGLIGIAWFIYMLTTYGIISLEAFEPTDDMENITVVSLAAPSSQHNKTTNSGHTNANLYGDRKTVSLTLSGFYIGYFYTVVNLTIFIVLLIGVFKRKASLCMLWFNVRCAVLIFKVVILFIYLIGGVKFYPVQIPFILSMIIHVYGLWIVNSYVNQLRFQQLSSACCKTRALADQREESEVQRQLALANQKLKEQPTPPEFKKTSDDSSVKHDELWAGIEILQRKRISSTANQEAKECGHDNNEAVV